MLLNNNKAYRDKSYQIRRDAEVTIAIALRILTVYCIGKSHRDRDDQFSDNVVLFCALKGRQAPGDS